MMSESKHTPGEWKIRYDSKSSALVKGNWIIYVDESCGDCGKIRKRSIASLAQWNQLSDANKHEPEANAEFICLACNSHDDLLDALDAIGNDCEKLLNDSSDIDVYDLIGAIRDAAQEAIAKAGAA